MRSKERARSTSSALSSGAGRSSSAKRGAVSTTRDARKGELLLLAE